VSLAGGAAEAVGILPDEATAMATEAAEAINLRAIENRQKERDVRGSS
jgi:hypothetical protein